MAPRIGLSLGTKLIVATVLLLAGAIGISAFYSLRTLDGLATSYANARRAEHEAAMSRETAIIVRNVVRNAGLPLSESNYTYLQSLVQTTVGDSKNLEWILVADSASDRVVARTDKAPASEQLRDALTEELDKMPTSDEQHKISDPKDPNRLIYGANIVIGSQRVGQVRLSLDTSDLEKAKAAAIADGKKRARESARRQLLFAGFILLIGILLGAWEGVRITRPLQALSIQARHIAGGDFGQRAHVSSKDEIGQLAESFNSMAESLGVLIEEMTHKASLEREVEVARSIQGLMTPPLDPLDIGPFSLAGRCEMASSCGGDWWTYRELSDGRLLVVVGDVTGHGMPAAMIAATARGAVEALSMVDHASLTPTMVLLAIDRAIRDVGHRQLLMTCFAMMVSPDGRVSFSNAGHTFPYVLHRGQGTERTELTVLTVRSNPLGIAIPYINSGEHRMNPNDILVLTSDGLTDRVSDTGERFGDRRLRKTLTSDIAAVGDHVASLRDFIVDEINRFAGATPSDDDMTLVVLQFRGAAEEPERGRRPAARKGAAA
jgi:sigma-B regulation protein RsbU (phosphoserine phosphatase)